MLDMLATSQQLSDYDARKSMRLGSSSGLSRSMLDFQSSFLEVPRFSADASSANLRVMK